MRRTALVAAALALTATGCMFPQGWHWPRTGPSTTETVIYVQNDVTPHQRDHLAWAAGYYNGHPELAIRLVDTCPAAVNCVVVRTVDLPYPTAGATAISFNSARHLLTALIRLDPTVGQGTTYQARTTIFHEFCHALGGGFRSDIHQLCNWEWRTMIFTEISRVYHDDLG